MTYSVWQSFITDGGEQVVAAATVSVYLEASGAPATLYDGPAGSPVGSSVVSGLDGLARFFVAGGVYKIVASKGAFSKEFRHVQIGTAASRDAGEPGGVATLDAVSLVPSEQVPSYAFANLAAFPATGALGKIYLARDTGKLYTPVAGGGAGYDPVANAIQESELSDVSSTVSIAGFEANLVAANRNAVGFNRNAAGAGVAQSSAIGADWDFTHVNTTGFLSSIVARNGAWLGAADTFTWLEVNLPIGVIIGDSIAEGHGSPDRHGRLHTGTVPIFDLALPNVAGQPSFHLSEKTGMHWLNQGIGGQTSSQVWARWSRDALGNTATVGDGRPDTTLDQKPYCVWVNVGINDISTGVPAATTKTNLLNMAKSARDNGIVVGFNTVGPNNSHTAGQIQEQKDLSKWMLETLPRFGAYVFDFRTWFDNPASPDTVNPLLAADSVHPRGAGYISYVSELIKQTAAPIVMEKICVESKVDPDGTPSSYVLLRQVRVEHVASGVDYVANIANLEAHIPSIFNMTNTRSLRFYPTETSGYPVSGTNRVTISRVYGVFGNAKQSIPDSRRAFAMLKSVSAVYSVESTYPRENVIDVSIISTTHLRVRFTRIVRNVKVIAQGSNRLYDLSVAITTSPAREALIYIIDKATGLSIDPNTTIGTFFFSVEAI